LDVAFVYGEGAAGVARQSFHAQRFLKTERERKRKEGNTESTKEPEKC